MEAPATKLTKLGDSRVAASKQRHVFILFIDISIFHANKLLKDAIIENKGNTNVI